jgi:hypothetical protein
MSRHDQDEHHKELSQFGSALKLVWWRYGRRLGLLGVILVMAAFWTGNRYEGGWQT